MLVEPGRLRRCASVFLPTIVLVLASLVLPALNTAAEAADPCGAGGNKITCENSLPGTPGWDVFGAGDETIQGFSTDISVNAGQRIDFKVDTDARAYTVGIYRIGYYQGIGARRITTVNPSVPLPQNQPQCISDVTTELYDCGNWAVSASWNVPSTAVSGVYVARLTRTDTGGASHITFVVRQDASTSAVVFQTSDTTWQAYNTYGGSDFYQGGANGRAYKLSYNRPVLTRGTASGRDFFFANEYPLVRFLEKNGYDTSYIAGVDTDRRGHLLTNHKVFLSVGHDEYWSKAQRANVEAARAAGVNLQFLSGNEMYWKTRYEPSADASHTPYRTMVSYKETWANAKIDPSPEWTGTWRDPRFAATSTGAGMVENGLTGTAYMSNFSDLPLTVSAGEGKYRLWRNTTVANLSSGSVQLAPHTVGYESNEDLDNGFRPQGLIRLSTTKGPVAEYLQDYGNTVAAGNTTHNITLYRAPSGALVFSAGTVQWTWGLDEDHDSAYSAQPADRRMQQAQVNLFADMGVQPASLEPGLVAASKSTDTTKPVVTITSPASNAAQKNGDRVTLVGTASDTGGRVAGVEVSTDSGVTWHPATGTTSWTYSFIQHGRGSTPVRVRAVDDSANIGNATTRSFTVSCPCSIFGQTVPPVTATPDGGAVELGLKFSPAVDGFVTGVRFYKGAGNTGTHVGSLWSSAGARLSQVTFSAETASGWQTATFGSPVPVATGQTYTVSYSAPAGHYSSQTNAFTAFGQDANLLKVAGGFGTSPAGVYGATGAFPTASFQRSNYFVDVTFGTADDAPLSAMNHLPALDATAVPATTKVSAQFSKPVSTGSVSLTVKNSAGATITGSTSYNSTTRTVTFTPASPLAQFVVHTATLTATDVKGEALGSGKTWTFRTARPTNPPGVCPCSLFGEDTLPAIVEDSDTVAVSLGVRFSPEVNGLVTGMRFYKGPGNTGTHTGTLWTQSGAELATGTFTGETTNGWQELTFDTPVMVTKDTQYVVSYRAPNGRYSATPNAFALSDLSKSPLRVSSTAGAYTYGAGFPGQSSPSSYLVDVIFERRPVAMTITSQQPAPGAVGTPRGSKVVVDFSNPVAPGWSFSLKQGATTVAGTAVLDADGTRMTWTPSSLLPAGAQLTARLTGVVSTDAVPLADQTWTFTTRDAESTSNQTLFADVSPEVTATGDAAPIEVGTAFTPSRDGFVKAIRFFKGPGNTGTHTGSIWTAGGSRLAQVTFGSETATGWQSATLAEPLAVTAGTTYLVSYFAPQGRYATTGNFFAAPWTNGDLTAPANDNGRYVYGGGYPAYSFASTNYFVDVLFERATAQLSVTERTPANNATEVGLSTRPSLTVSAQLAPGWSMTLKKGTTAVAGSATLSADGRTVTFVPDNRLDPLSDYTVTTTSLTSSQGGALPAQAWTFQTGPDDAGKTSMFAGMTPAVVDAGDGGAIELGTAFTPSVDGEVTAVKFYKAAGNTGTHTGSIWSSAGSRLGTVTFVGESASGWQTATLATPVAVTAGQTYVVSYYAPNGHYSVSGGFFTAPHVSGPLTAPGTNNGRYTYGGGGGFPVDSWNATNYFVDVVFGAAP